MEKAAARVYRDPRARLDPELTGASQPRPLTQSSPPERGEDGPAPREGEGSRTANLRRSQALRSGPGQLPSFILLAIVLF